MPCKGTFHKSLFHPPQQNAGYLMIVTNIKKKKKVSTQHL